MFCDVQARRGVEKGMPEESLGACEHTEVNAAKWLGQHGGDHPLRQHRDAGHQRGLGVPEASHQLPGIRDDSRRGRVAIRRQRRGCSGHRAQGIAPEQPRKDVFYMTQATMEMRAKELGLEPLFTIKGLAAYL